MFKIKISWKIALIVFGALIIVLIIIFIIRSGVVNRSVETEKIVSAEMLWPDLSFDKKYIYYFSNESEPAFYKINLESKKIDKISDNFDTPNRVIWSPDHQKAILIVTYQKYIFEKYDSPFVNPDTPDQTETKWFYDFNTKKLKKLDDDITAILWLNNDKIIYHYTDNDTISEIDLASPDGSSKEVLYNLGEIYLDNLLALRNRDLYYIATVGEGVMNLYSLNLDIRQPLLIIEDINKNISISPTGDKFFIKIDLLTKPTIGWSPTKDTKIKDTGINSEFEATVWLDGDRFLMTNNNKFYIFDITNGRQRVLNPKFNLSNLQTILPFDNHSFYFLANNVLYKLGF